MFSKSPKKSGTIKVETRISKKGEHSYQNMNHSILLPMIELVKAAYTNSAKKSLQKNNKIFEMHQLSNEIATNPKISQINPTDRVSPDIFLMDKFRNSKNRRLTKEKLPSINESLLASFEAINKSFKENTILKYQVELVNQKVQKHFKVYIAECPVREIFLKILKEYHEFQVETQIGGIDWGVIWKPTANKVSFGLFQKKTSRYKFNLKKPIFFNHFQFSEHIGEKDNLLSNLTRALGKKAFDFMPPTFVIGQRLDTHKGGLDLGKMKLMMQLIKNCEITNGEIKMVDCIEKLYSDSEQLLIKKKLGMYDHLCFDEIPSVFNGGANTWIVKPTSFNRGNGWKILQKEKDFTKVINEIETELSESFNKPIKLYSVIFQKYLEKPLLIQGRKFDIRMWVFGDVKMNFYIFCEGYLRMSSKQYSLDSTDQFIHLTNHAVQKYWSDYSFFEQSNMVSFSSFKNYLAEMPVEEGASKISFEDKIFPSMVNITKTWFQHLKEKINPGGMENLFEVFGMDFMVDHLGSVWLIEVNANPDLSQPSEILKKLVPRMMSDLTELTINKVFIPTKVPTTVYPVEGYRNDQNMWYKII